MVHQTPDAKKLAYVRQIIEDQKQLAEHYRENGWPIESTEAGAFNKIRKYLEQKDEDRV